MDPNDHAVKDGFADLLVESCTRPREAITGDKMSLATLLVASISKE